MKVYNGTDHELNFYHKRDTAPVPRSRKIDVKDDAEPHTTIPKMTPLNAEFDEEESILFGDVTNTTKRVSHVDPTPVGYDIVVVSGLYMAAAQQEGVDTTRLRTVKDPVQKNGKIVGCLGLMSLESPRPPAYGDPYDGMEAKDYEALFEE